jgi:tetratricopeptide (TPR) repeat protein
MKTRMNYDPLIIRYRNGDLTSAQREDFEERLKTDRELEEAYRLHCNVDAALQMDDDNRFRDMLDDIHVELERKRQVPRWIWYAAATVIICVAVALALVLIKGKPATVDKLFAFYYTPYESPGDIRSAAGTEESPLVFGLELYEEHDYEGALTQLQEVIRTDPASNEAQFYAGATLMELDRFAEAIPFFRKVINNHDVLFSDQARWYLALACLKTGDVDQAKRLFTELKETSRYYRDNAGTILQKINH